MNSVSTQRVEGGAFSLPNVLTYCRIARGSAGRRLHVLADDPAGRAVAPAGCARDLHRRRHHRFLRRLFRAHLGPAIAARPHARSDRRQAAGRVLPADAGGRRNHQGLVAVRGHHHPVPRNPGVGPARISRRIARERAGDAAGQVEDHAAAGRDRLPAGRRSGRLLSAGKFHGMALEIRRRTAGADHHRRPRAALGVGDPDALYRLGLFPRRACGISSTTDACRRNSGAFRATSIRGRLPSRFEDKSEASVFRVGARAHRQDRRGGRARRRRSRPWRT